MIFTLKDSSIFPSCMVHFLFIWDLKIFNMNKRFIIVGIVLGIVIALAVIIGSPALGGFDSMR